MTLDLGAVSLTPTVSVDYLKSKKKKKKRVVLLSALHKYSLSPGFLFSTQRAKRNE